jgi:hypothetical protein
MARKTEEFFYMEDGKQQDCDLHNPILRGKRSHVSKELLAELGLPEDFCDPLIDEDKLNKIRTKHKKKNIDEAFNEKLHKRRPKGTPKGGQFAPKYLSMYSKKNDIQPNDLELEKTSANIWAGLKPLHGYIPHSVRGAFFTSTIGDFIDKMDADNDGDKLNEPLQKIHQLIKKAVGNTPIIFTSSGLSQEDNKDSMGYYKPGNLPGSNIPYYTNSEIVVLVDKITTGLWADKYLQNYIITHEMIHAATVEGIRNSKEIQHYIKGIMNIVENSLIGLAGEKEYVTPNDLGIDVKNSRLFATTRIPANMKNPQYNYDYGHLPNTDKPIGLYGLDNQYEFVAEAMSNISFQQALTKIKLDDEQADVLGLPDWARASNLWDTFLCIIRKILGLPDDKKYFNALDAITSVVERQALQTYPNLKDDKNKYLQAVPSHRLFERIREACKKIE